MLTVAHQAIPAELRQSAPERGAAMVTDVDDGKGPDEDLPEASKEGALEAAKDKHGNVIKADPHAEEQPYTRTGWAPQLGWPQEKSSEAASLLDHRTWLEGRLPDQLYGGTWTRRLLDEHITNLH